MKVSCRSCESAFHLPDATVDELEAEAFCPFCGDRLPLRSTVPVAAPGPPDEQAGALTRGWAEVQAALGRPVAVMAEVEGRPGQQVPLDLPDERAGGQEGGLATAQMERRPSAAARHTDAFRGGRAVLPSAPEPGGSSPPARPRGAPIASPGPSVLAELSALDPQENILTSPVVAARRSPRTSPPPPEPAPEPPPPRASTPAPPAGASEPATEDRAPRTFEMVFAPDEPSERRPEGEGPPVEATDDATVTGVGAWRLACDGDQGLPQTRADVLRRMRDGELGQAERVAPADAPAGRWWTLVEVPDFRRYAQLFGRPPGAAPTTGGRRSFWARFRR